MRKCLVCGIEFEPSIGNVKKGYGKYCSCKCSGIARRGKSAWNKGLKGFMAGSKNHWFGKDRKDEKSETWKGNKVGYRGLHLWVELHLGKPMKCSFCGLTRIPTGYKRYFQWANKSGEYKRELTDWIRLCVKCHKAFDGYRIGEYVN
jgi:hypothetical protein